MICPSCGTEMLEDGDDRHCPECQYVEHNRTSDATDLSAVAGMLDKQDVELDELVAQASIPDLATLFQRGKDAGLIKPVQEYTSGG